MKPIRHHYPVRPVDAPSVSLRGVGIHERRRAGTVNRPHGIDTFLFVLFHTTASNSSSGTNTHFAPGSLVIWEPFAPHDFGDHRQEWDHTWMLVGGRLVAREIRRLKIPCATPLIAPIAALTEKTFLEIDREAAQEPADPVFIGNLLQNFLISLSRAIHGRRGSSEVPQEFLKVKTFMDSHFNEPLTLRQLAGMVHRSVPRFATRFKHFFGLPPLDYLIRLRMHRAQFLLHDQSYNIAEVGQAVGYPDPHYFSRLFRMRLGYSPRQARQHNAEPRARPANPGASRAVAARREA